MAREEHFLDRLPISPNAFLTNDEGDLLPAQRLQHILLEDQPFLLRQLQEERTYMDGNANVRVRLHSGLDDSPGLTLCEVFSPDPIVHQLPPLPVPPTGRPLKDLLARIYGCEKAPDLRPDWLRTCMGPRQSSLDRAHRRAGPAPKLSKKQKAAAAQLEKKFHRHSQCLNQLLSLARSAGQKPERALLLPSTLLPPQA